MKRILVILSGSVLLLILSGCASTSQRSESTRVRTGYPVASEEPVTAHAWTLGLFTDSDGF